MQDREREARSISGLCPTRPVLPQGAQSRLRGARLNINQVAALKARDRKLAFPGRRAPQENSPSTTESHSVDCRPQERAEHHITLGSV